MNDPLIDIWQYSTTLKISQVVAFFNRKGITMTRAMIQNYVRLGLCPSPNGHWYGHKHLAALAMIDKLKSVFELHQVREAIAPLMDSEGLPLDTYSALFSRADGLVRAFAQTAAPEMEKQHDNGTLLTMLCAAFLREAVLRN
jgi:hypothetical protein